MQLIVKAGNAKSIAMQALAAAREGNFALAKQKLEESDSAMTEAHQVQTEILQDSLEQPGEGVRMLMCHAQDHMMNAITALDFAREIVALYGLLAEKEKGGFTK